MLPVEACADEQEANPEAEVGVSPSKMRVFHLLYHRAAENTQYQQQDPITPIGQVNWPSRCPAEVPATGRPDARDEDQPHSNQERGFFIECGLQAWSRRGRFATADLRSRIACCGYSTTRSACS